MVQKGDMRIYGISISCLETMLCKRCIGCVWDFMVIAKAIMMFYIAT